jgi:hypothetical protein
MARPKQAVILRVHRNVAGVTFPWDCVYFFRQGEESLLPDIFPCSLVIVMTKRFTRLVKKAFESPRGDRGKDKAFPHHRKDAEKLGKHVTRKSPMEMVFDNPKDFIALVPTLHLRGKHEEGKSGPVYLTARPRAPAVKSTSTQRKTNKRGKSTYTTRGKFTTARPMREQIVKKLMREAMSSKAYFLFRGEKIQPPCLCCPNNLEYLDGKCDFGLERCYTSLDQARESDFEEALRLYKSLIQPSKEPEVTDEQLSGNEG